MIHAEEFLDATIATLKANLPAALAAINAAHTDFQVAVPDDDSYSTGTLDILRYPWIEVAVPDFSISNFSMEQWDADFYPVVIVRGLYQEPLSADRLDRALKRYGQALLNVLLTPNAFGAHEVVQSVRGGYRVNPETQERTEFTGGVVAAFTIESTVTRT